jgi:hypothetical protein
MLLRGGWNWLMVEFRGFGINSIETSGSNAKVKNAGATHPLCYTSSRRPA